MRAVRDGRATLRELLIAEGVRDAGRIHTELFHVEPGAAARRSTRAGRRRRGRRARSRSRLDGRTSTLDLRPDDVAGARRRAAGARRRCRSPARAASAAPAGPRSSRAGRDGRQLRARARRGRAGLRADLPVAPDVRRRSSSTTTPEPSPALGTVAAWRLATSAASGLKISAIAYGNWLTHGSQVEEDAALACVRQALDEGITTFDTADVYANTKAETVLGKALKGERREGLEIFTKVYWPDRPRRAQRPRPVAQAHPGVDRRLAAAAAAPTTSTSTRRTATTTRRRSRRRWRPSPTSCTPARRSTSASRSGAPSRSGAAHALARELRDPAGLEPAAVQHALAGHRGRGRADLRGARHRPDRLVADRAGRADRQVQAGPAAAGRLARHRRQGRRRHDLALDEATTCSSASSSSQPIADEAGLSLAQLAVAWVLQNDNVSAAIIGASRPEQVTENVKAAGVTLDAAALKAIDEVLDPVVERDPAKTQSPRTPGLLSSSRRRGRRRLSGSARAAAGRS